MLAWLASWLIRVLNRIDPPYGTHVLASGASAPVGAPDREDRARPQQSRSLAAAPARRNCALLGAGAAIPAIPPSRLSPEADRITRPLVVVVAAGVQADNSRAAMQQVLDALRALP